MHRIFLTEADVSRVRSKAREHEWARQIAAQARERADAWLIRPQPLREGETGWGHNYFDPRYGVRLEYDPARPHEHRSPVDGQIFSGGEYDAAWLYLTHTRVAGAALDLALGYVLSGEAAYARGAAEILREYARRYPAARVHGKWAGQGKIMGQSLDEAVWVISLLRAYDLVAAETLGAADRRTVEQDLFAAAARLLRPQTNRIHNIHSWHDAALTMIGLAIGDAELVEFAIADPASGFIAQATQGVKEDGFWYEGSIGYHFYTLSAFQHLIGALRAAGRSAPEEERVRRMYRAPVLYADPDLVFPALNDGWAGMTLAGQASHYEVAAAWFDDPLFVNVLCSLYADGKRPRGSLSALLYGPPELPAPASPAASGAPALAGCSHNFTASGIGILRRGRNYALVKYGPHGGGHGHPDKLGFVLYGLGEMLSPDLGTPGYGVPLTRSWYRQTVSHNTLVVDETTQSPATGKLLSWVEGDGFDAITVSVADAYPGVELRRTLILTGRCLAFVDSAVSRENHVFDWAYHQRGRWSPEASGGLNDVAVGERLGQSAGYEHLVNVRRAQVDGAWRVAWVTPGGRRVSLSMAGGSAAEVFLAEGPGNPATETLPAVIVRRRGESAVWAGVFDLTGSGAVQGVELLEAGTGQQDAPPLGAGERAVRVLAKDGPATFVIDESGHVGPGAD